jgi:cytochrome c553
MKPQIALLLGSVMFVAGGSLAAAADAKTNWEDHCAKCHGAAGKAETRMGQRLKLKDYSDPKVQSELTDEVILKATLEGVKGADGKEKMQGYADKLSTDDAKALLALIRSFKQ